MHRSKQSILIDEIRPIGDQTASGGWENTMFTHCSAWKPKSNQTWWQAWNVARCFSDRPFCNAGEG